MNKPIFEQTLALAGIFQASILVDSIAREGRADPQAFATSLGSLFVSDPREATDVYGGLGGVRIGLEAIRTQFAGRPDQRNTQVTRYVLTLLHLERKLTKLPAMLQQVGEGIDNTGRQAEHFGDRLHPNVIGGLADVYSKTISTLNPRIMVGGEHGHLNNPDNANRIRALLLAGIRSAVLFTQCGGGRLKVLFRRKAYVSAAGALWAEALEAAGEEHAE